MKPWPILTPTGLDTAALSIPLRARKPWTYTVGDVFALPPEQCAAVFGVMAATPQHRYMVEAGPGAAGWFAWFKQAAEFRAITCDCSNEEGRLRTLQDFGARAAGIDDSLDATPWLIINACPLPLPNVHLVTPECSTQTVWFIMVDHPTGAKRVGPAYGTSKAARDWLKFVAASFRGAFRTYVERCRLTLVDGKLDAASRAVLDTKYNMDAPEVPRG